MGFRINRGIFQYKKDDGTFANKFMLDKDSGRIMEVDEGGNMTDGYLKLGEKASDSDKLDGVNSSQFLRSDASDNVTGHTEWQDGYEVRLGNSADFRMRFDGSHTYFRNYNHGNGNIYFQGEDTAGANHALLYMFTANTRPYVSLYEDGAERFKTKSNGVEVLGDAFINQGRIHIKRGTGLTHAEWEDDSSANGRAQLILDSHYSDLIIASRNANNNKHGSTFTLATQSTSTNDVAKWVIGQGQYQEGANIMAFAYGTNQTNPHSILGTDNANAEMLLTNGSGLWLRNNLHANQVFMQSITSDGDIANDKGSYLHIGGWGVGRTATNAVLVNTAYRADYATNLFNENISRFANDANYLTQDALTSVEEGLRAEINGVETVANSKQDAGNYATFTNNITLNNSATTANFIAELTNEHGAFQNNYKAFKVTWSYAGNSNLDVGFESVELAGCLIECWGGTYKHVRLTRPTTGTGGRSIYVYNDQGSGYAPGWRQIWTSDEFGQGNVNNWNTAHGWGNHAGLYDAAGEAQAVQDNLDGLSGSLGSLALEDSVTISEVTGLQTALDGKLSTTGKAADSNLLDGVNSDRFVYGGNSTKTTNVSNFSTALNSGFYDGYNATGNPTSSWYTLINMRHNNTSNNYGSQIAVSFYSNADMYVRTISNGTYQGWSKIWNSANFDPASKLGATAKAADSDKLDGYDWMQSGKSVRGSEVYADGWLRNYNTKKGLYNQATGQHFYSDDDDYWNIAGGTGANGLRFRDEHDGTIRGYVYANNSNEVGFLDVGGSWAVKHTNDNGTRFYTDNSTLEFRVGRDAVSGNYGTVQTSTTRGGWGGYSINGQYVLMSNHGNDVGIYNDIDNEWMTRWYRNGKTQLHYNGSAKLETTGLGVTVTGKLTATNFVGDGSGLTGIQVPGQAATVTGGGEPVSVTVSSIDFNPDRQVITFTLSDGSSYQTPLMMGK